MSTTVDTASEIRPFEVAISEEKIEELRRRIGATRLPSKELVDVPDGKTVEDQVRRGEGRLGAPDLSI